jgi:hypothetical protein
MYNARTTAFHSCHCSTLTSFPSSPLSP